MIRAEDVGIRRFEAIISSSHFSNTKGFRNGLLLETVASRASIGHWKWRRFEKATRQVIVKQVQMMSLSMMSARFAGDTAIRYRTNDEDRRHKMQPFIFCNGLPLAELLWNSIAVGICLNGWASSDTYVIIASQRYHSRNYSVCAQVNGWLRVRSTAHASLAQSLRRRILSTGETEHDVWYTRMINLANHGQSVFALKSLAENMSPDRKKMATGGRMRRFSIRLEAFYRMCFVPRLEQNLTSIYIIRERWFDVKMTASQPKSEKETAPISSCNLKRSVTTDNEGDTALTWP